MINEINTFKNHIKKINGFEANSNKNEMKTFGILKQVKSLELWKKLSYYKGAPEYEFCASVTFDVFLKKAFGRTIQWYSSIERTLKLKKGSELFVKYGRSNMVTYMNSTEDERVAIIEKFENGVVSRSFSCIKRSLYPVLNKVSIKDIENINDKLKNENKLLKSKVEKLELKNKAINTNIDAYSKNYKELLGRHNESLDQIEKLKKALSAFT